MTPRKFVLTVSAVLTLVLLSTGCGPSTTDVALRSIDVDREIDELKTIIFHQNQVILDHDKQVTEMMRQILILHEYLGTPAWRELKGFKPEGFGS